MLQIFTDLILYWRNVKKALQILAKVNFFNKINLYSHPQMCLKSLIRLRVKERQKWQILNHLKKEY